MTRLALFPLLLLPACAATAAGPEVQLYPAGLIGAAHFQYALGEDDALTWRIGANLTERGDFGEHDDESGSGFGGGVGWRRTVEDGPDPGVGWVWGARVDFWQMDIDWKDRAPLRRGNTETVVFQPTVEAGYLWPLGGGWRAQILAGLGAEINTGEDGEDVGEGLILLVGVTFLRDV